MRFQLALLVASSACVLWAAEPDAKTIVANSVEANKRDYAAAPRYDHKETDRKGAEGTKTYQVTMIDGSPYQRLIAIDGKPLSGAQQQAEQQKERQVRNKRDRESPQERRTRIAKYERDRRRDNQMMNQLTVAFTFQLVGSEKVDDCDVYHLKATPRPGYKPINTATQVLPGMTGELWIDQKTYQWVKVTAQVIHPVSIEGFLAQVEPGTRFELEKAPVGDGSVWLVSHFSMNSNARVFHMFSRTSQEDDTFSDYRLASK